MKWEIGLERMLSLEKGKSIRLKLMLVLVLSLLLVLFIQTSAFADIEPTNDNIPGEAIQASPVTGTLDEFVDTDDIYAINLSAGQTLSVSIIGPDPVTTDFDLSLFAPGSTDIFINIPVAGAYDVIYPDSFSYTVPSGAGGTYYLDAEALTGSGAYTITYTVTNAPAVITCSPVSFDFTGTQGGSNPPNQTLTVANTGGTALNWTVTENASWLSLSPTSGTNTGYVTVSTSITALSAGVYYTNIVLSATGASNTPVVIPVCLIVNQPGGTDDNIPGVPLPSSPVSGTLDTTTDADDVYRVKLWSGQKISLELTATAGSGFDLYFYPVGSTNIATDTPVASTTASSYPKKVSYTVPAGMNGYYFLDVRANSGSGDYSIKHTISSAVPTYYYPWYDCQGMKTWILLGNPQSTTVFADIYVGGLFKQTVTLLAGQSYYAYYAGEMGGPVEIYASKPIFTTQRSLFEGSFCEVAGISSSLLASSYYFPWYDCRDMDTWILVGNPQDTIANVNISIAGSVRETMTLFPGESFYAFYSGDIGGPIKIDSSTPVYATQRSLYGPTAAFATSFCEVPGIAGTSLASSYYYPWYDCQGMRTWILVGNPSSSTSVYFEIYVAGNFKQAITLAPGQSYYALYDGLMDGPVFIVAGGPVFTTQRSLYGPAPGFLTSFCEVPGISSSSLSEVHYFPWYDGQGMRTWVLVGNPNPATVYVDVKVGSYYLASGYAIVGGGRAYFIQDGLMNGPVEVDSSAPVFATQRSIYANSFWEISGLKVP